MGFSGAGDVYPFLEKIRQWVIYITIYQEKPFRFLPEKAFAIHI
jgi:hypothetical protein